MYKLTILFLAGCITCLSAGAQSKTTYRAMKEQLQLVQQLNARALPAVAKTTAIQQRLTGSSTGDGQGQVYDSMVYRYSSGRGSEFDINNLQYNLLVDNIPLAPEKAVLYDTVYEQVQGDRHWSASYLPGNLLQQQTEYNGAYALRNTWTYNVQNLVTNLLRTAYDAGSAAWVPFQNNSYVYDAQDRLVSDTEAHYMVGNVTETVSGYHYNSAGLADTVNYRQYNGSIWALISRTVLVYTGTQVASSTFQVYNGTAWDTVSKIEFSYSGNRKTSEQFYLWQSGSWSVEQEEFRHLDASNLPDSVFYRELDFGWDTTIYKLSYNSFENPVTIDHYDGSMNFMTRERFTYQDYDPAAIPSIPTAKALTIYPNPAKAQLTIAASTLAAGQVSYHIINAVGQVVRSSDCNIKGDKIVVDIQGLAPGMYWLQLQDAKGNWYRAGFSKVE